MRTKKPQTTPLLSIRKIAPFAVIAAVLLLGAGFWYLHSSRPVNESKRPVYESKRTSGTTDEQAAKDLYVLEKAILSYDADPGRPLGTLPSSLNDIQLEGFEGNLSEYSYRVTQQAETGAPGVSYEICATFSAANGLKGDISDYTHSQVGERAYMRHVAGKQCFKNSYYKGSSHISISLVR